MLQRIETTENIPDFIEGVKDGDERLMGFGHRVYKNYDPRATIIKKACRRRLRGHGHEPAARHRARAREDRARGRLLRLAQALPERRLLLGPHLRGARPAGRDVPGDVRDRPHERLDRPVAGDGRRHGAEDRAPAPDLHGRARARLRADRPALEARRDAALSRRRSARAVWPARHRTSPDPPRRSVGVVELRLDNGTAVVIRPIRAGGQGAASRRPRAAVRAERLRSASSRPKPRAQRRRAALPDRDRLPSTTVAVRRGAARATRRRSSASAAGSATSDDPRGRRGRDRGRPTRCRARASARRLGLAIADAARVRGVRRFTATMLSDNLAAQRLFAAISERLEVEHDGATDEITADARRLTAARRALASPPWRGDTS